MKIKILSIIFLIATQAQAFQDLYFPDNKGLKLSEEASSLSYKLKVLNEGSEDSGIFFPLYPQLHNVEGTFLEKDSCAFKVLKTKESCEVVLHFTESTPKMVVKFYQYSLEEKSHDISIGHSDPKPIISLDSSLGVEKIDLKQPLPVGFDSSLSLELDCKFLEDAEISTPLENLKLVKEKNKCYLEATYFPVEENFNKVPVVLKNKSGIHQVEVTIPSVLKKVLSLKNPYKNVRSYYSEGNPLHIVVMGDLLLSSDEPLDVSLMEGEVIEGSGELMKIPSGLFYIPKSAGIHKVKIQVAGLTTERAFDLKTMPVSEAKDFVADNTELDNSQGNVFLFKTLILKKDLIIHNTRERVSYVWAEKIEGPGKIILKGSFEGSQEVPGLGISAIPNGSMESCKGDALFIYPETKSFHQAAGQCIFSQKMEPFIQEKAIKESSHSAVEDNIFSGAFWEILNYNIAFTILIALFFILYATMKTRRTQPNRSYYKGQIISEVFWCFISVVVVQYGVQILSTILNRQEFLQIYNTKDQYGLIYYYWSFVGIVLLHDTFFYWTHRLLHLPWFFKHIHFRHHKSKTVSPLTSYNFHPLEALMHFSFVPLLLLFVPVHSNVLVFFLYYHMFFNIMGHSGWFWTGKLIKTPLVYLYNMKNHHDLHHEKVNGNFSIYFNFWDKIMGTNFKEYDDQHK